MSVDEARKQSTHNAFSEDCQFFLQWVYLTAGCISLSSRVFRTGLGYAKVASFFHRNWDQVFRCSVLEVFLQGSVVGPFSGLMRKAILKQAKTELPSDTVQLRHTGVTMGSGVL